MSWKLAIGLSLLHYKDGTREWWLGIPENYESSNWIISGRAASRDEAVKLANEAIDRLPDQISN